MTRSKAIAAAITAIIAFLLFLWLRLSYLSFSAQPAEWPPRHDGEVVMADEQFFDVIEAPFPSPAVNDPAKAFNEVDADNASTPAPQSGNDLSNSGKPGDAPVPVTSKQPSTVKENPQPATPVGPSKEELEQEEAKRKATSAVSSAFRNATGSNNTQNTGASEGNSGSPSGTSSAVNGTGTGSVGGGWRMPSYAKVPSTLTGSIKLMLKIDRDGRVKSVEFQGGEPPAATDARLRQAIEREVRSRRFTRSDAAAPDEATAFVTYRFQ